MRAFVILCAFVIGACGGHDNGGIDDVIGAACVSDRDCDSNCYTGGHFPGGFCSTPCNTDNDCPEDTYCMADAEGVCMFICPQFDCTRLGAGWGCHDEPRLNGSHVNVCIGN